MLSLEDVAVDRGGVPILQGVTLRVRPGAAIVLRGPNGSGKTTLLRAVAGLQPVAAGRIAEPPEGPAYAAHADGIKGVMTVAENLHFWAAVHGTGAAAVGAALERMNLRALAGRPAQNLSAGQKRRLGLARLLVAGRGLWLLDEPTVSLDAASVALFAGVVADHLAAGGAVLAATHIDLSIPGAADFDLAPFRARAPERAADLFGEGVA